MNRTRVFLAGLGMLIVLSVGLFACKGDKSPMGSNNNNSSDSDIAFESNRSSNKQINHDWLIGEWEMYSAEGFPPEIEYFQFQYIFLNEQDLQISSLTKFSQYYVQKRMRDNPYAGSSDINVDREVVKYKVDNENYEIIYYDETGANTLLFDESRKRLNIGSPNNPKYIKKERGIDGYTERPVETNSATPTPDAMESSKSKTRAGENESYFVTSRVYFHSEPYESYSTKKYLDKGDVVLIQSIQNGFGYTVFTNERGIQTRGWIKMINLDINPICGTWEAVEVDGMGYNFPTLLLEKDGLATFQTSDDWAYCGTFDYHGNHVIFTGKPCGDHAEGNEPNEKFKFTIRGNKLIDMYGDALANRD